jgi:hypothetical protein
MKMWTKFMWLRKGISGGLYEQYYEPLGYMEAREFVGQLSGCWFLKKNCGPVSS